MKQSFKFYDFWCEEAVLHFSKDTPSVANGNTQGISSLEPSVDESASAAQAADQAGDPDVDMADSEKTALDQDPEPTESKIDQSESEIDTMKDATSNDIS